MPSVMRLFGALGGLLDDEEVRATFNGGLGMVIVASRPGRQPARRSPDSAADDPRVVVVLGRVDGSLARAPATRGPVGG